jgi:hypothetical protein
VHAPIVLVAALLAGSLEPAPHGSAAPPSARAREEVSTLVRRCVAAYGGKRAIAKAASSRQEGKVTSILHGADVGRIVRAYSRPGRLRVEIAFPGGAPEIRVVDGVRGWREGQEVEGPRLAAMVLQAFRLDLPALLASWEARLEDRGTSVQAGSPVRVLAIEPAPGLVVEAMLDPATGRIVRSRGFSRGGPPIEFVTTYSDFRTVDGVLVAFREENWANGRVTGETVLEKVEFPKEIARETFRP